MATKIDCNACEDLRKSAPDFVQNGVSKTICNSMKNDTGLNPKLTTLHTDCEDLDTANDCLIGTMDKELSETDTCDLPSFIHNFILNIYNMFKLMICAICGLWESTHDLEDRATSLESRATKLEDRMDTAEDDIDTLNERVDSIDTQAETISCILNYIGKYKTMHITRDNITLGPGVSYRSADEAAIPAISGNAFCAYLTGGVKLDSTWLALSGDISDGGRLVYTYKLKKSSLDILRMWPATLTEANAGCGIIAHVSRFNEGEEYWGYESMNDTNGAGTVPAGYIYLQVRIVSVVSWGRSANTGNISLCGTMAVLMDMSADC